MNELYRLIHAEKANYPIVLLCRVLKVARSSYLKFPRDLGHVIVMPRERADAAAWSRPG